MPIDIGFEYIHPTPVYPAGRTSASYITYSWASQANQVTAFKQQLKDTLRLVQRGRCCFCRRPLADPMVTDLEHFIEKSAYPQFSFEITNLALSCRVCNSKKNTTFLRLHSSLNNRASRSGGNRTTYRCPTLAPHMAPLTALPSTAASYRWVHPHFDIYSDHLVIQKGWIFQWRTNKGLRTIRGLELNALAQLERRALAERIARGGGPLSWAFAALAELNNASAPQIASSLASYIRLRRAAIRAAQANNVPPHPQGTRRIRFRL